MKLLSLFLLACTLAVLPSVRSQTTVYNFDSDLDSLVSNRGIWEWTDRATFPWTLPDEGDGFAVIYAAGEGDELFEPSIDIQSGLEYEIKFFIASEFAGSTTLQIQLLSLDGTLVEIVEDFTDQSDPSNTDWITYNGVLPARDDAVNFGVFCQTNSLNSVGQILYGCAIDYVIIDRTSTETTPAPTTGPEDVVDWSFQVDTAGWTLGSSNGASWRRTNFSSSDPGVRPPSGDDHALQVFNHDTYSGTVLAMSPRLTVGESGVVSVTVEFFILVLQTDYPAYLKLRRRTSYTTYDDNVAINMDPYGDQVNQQWISLTQTFVGLTPGEEFNVVLEGNLGIANTQNHIYVNRVRMEGVTEIPYDETSFFDFEDGLVGWQAGSMDGGKWEVVPFADIDPSIDMPSPISRNVLIATRFDIHSGVITIESPPISIEPNTGKQINMRFWTRGTQVYPVLLRLVLKTMDGVYDETPFFDLAQYGDADHQTWLDLGAYVSIPVDPREPFFQIVFEVDIGGDYDNQVAIDLFALRTVEE